MPIRESERARYPADWPAIRDRIRARAGDCCEGCGIPNHAVVSGDRRTMITGPLADTLSMSDLKDSGWIRIICTVAHLDHTPENCADDNLRFWCQRCHNRYDAPHRAAGRRRRAFEASGQERK